MILIEEPKFKYPQLYYKAMPMGTNVDREREGRSFHIKIPQMKKGDTKLIFQKCGSLANIKKR